ncbi:Na/Pi cotransporter family protein [Lachnospiraceae bacterium NSJ-143]|nr:Na/Pi cotransporter family protein [Lachnospiraceae bacterium NSJ-143]
MDIFGVLSLFGGLAMFLFGMDIMGKGLERQAGNKLQLLLEKLTANPLKGFLLGLGVTAVIQSSSATTVMVVGFVNAGIMELRQAVGIIMGANVGTTVTAWILSLSGISGDSFIMQFLKPSSFTPFLALIGIILFMAAKSDKKKNIGSILLGFAVLMFGMDQMSAAVAPLTDVPEFTRLFTLFTNPLLGILAGAALTAVIQSSSASVGVLQALSVTGAITYGNAIPIIMGQNIGTCITAVLSSIGANKSAKRAAAVHLYFNVIGVIVFMVIFYIARAAIGFDFISEPVTKMGIAEVHTLFNIFATAVMLPFSGLLVKLAKMTVKDKSEKANDTIILDERFFAVPAVAVNQGELLAVKMSKTAREAIENAISLIKNYDDSKVKNIETLEEEVDRYEDVLGTYLVKLSNKDMSDTDSRRISRILHTIGDFERISDHAVNIKKAAQEMNSKGIAFSSEARIELTVLEEAIRSIVAVSVESFDRNDVELSKKVEPLEQVVNDLTRTIKNRHVERLKNGSCTIELGFVLSDLINNYERIADHCSNIAVAIIEVSRGSFDTHEYLTGLKDRDEEFIKLYNEYKRTYALS